jgi:hypothetical protein
LPNLPPKWWLFNAPAPPREPTEEEARKEAEEAEQREKMDAAYRVATEHAHSEQVYAQLESTIARAEAIWKRFTPRRLRPSAPDTHDCATLGCEMEPLEYLVYLMDDPASLSPRLHVCVAGHCAGDGDNSLGLEDRDAHRSVVPFRVDLFVCTRSGMRHECGERCKLVSWNQDATRVCQLTGMASFDQKRRDDQDWRVPGRLWTPVRNPRAQPRGRRRGWNARRVITGLDDSSAESMEALREQADGISRSNVDIRKLEKENLPRTPRQAKNLAWLVIYLRLMRIFSDDRMIDDMAKNQRLRDDKTDAVTGYLSRCKQHSMVPSAAEMMQLAATRVSKGVEIAEMAPSPDQRKVGGGRVFAFFFSLTLRPLSPPPLQRLADKYTAKVMALWYIVATRTPEGRKNPRAFPFEEFVTAAMHIFETGISVDCAGHRMDVVPVDPMIAEKPVTEWVERDLHERVKTDKQRNALLKKAQDRIEAAIYSAVGVDRVNPAELILDESTTIESMNDAVFLVYYSTKKTGQPTKAAMRNRVLSALQNGARKTPHALMLEGLPSTNFPSLPAPPQPQPQPQLQMQSVRRIASAPDGLQRIGSGLEFRLGRGERP